MEHPSPNEAVRAFLRERKLIPAIKAYREQHPEIGWQEAVDAVEAIDTQMQAEHLQ